MEIPFLNKLIYIYSIFKFNYLYTVLNSHHLKKTTPFIFIRSIGNV